MQATISVLVHVNGFVGNGSGAIEAKTFEGAVIALAKAVGSLGASNLDRSDTNLDRCAWLGFISNGHSYWPTTCPRILRWIQVRLTAKVFVLSHFTHRWLAGPTSSEGNYPSIGNRPRFCA